MLKLPNTELWDRNSDTGEKVFSHPSGRRNDGHGSKGARDVTMENLKAEHMAAQTLGK